jgi:hypothetical protein
LLLSLIALAPQATTINVKADQVRTAVQHEKLASLKQDVIVEGTAKAFGRDATFIIRIGAGGLYRFDLKSPLGRTIGYDGTRYWEADRTGATRVLAFGEADVQAVQRSLLSNGWLSKSSGSVAMAPDGRTLNVKLNGSEIEQAIEVDPQTYLPTKSTYQSSAGKVEVLLQDWRDTPAGKLPFRVVWREGGVEQSVQGTSVRPVPPTAVSYTLPVWTAKDTTFDTKASPVLETKRLPSGHVLVKPLIQGKDVGWFILDSGAEAMCVDKGVADELALPIIGEVPAVGVGGVVKVPFRSAKDFTLGPATIQNLVFVELDLAQISKLVNVKLGGIVGYDLFRRTVVELDVKKPSVSIFNPTTFSAKTAKWQPILFDGGNIGVQASFEGGQRGWFRLDTGAGGTVSFHGPFVEKLKLLEGREVGRVMEGGVGGMQEAKRGKLKYFELAGHRFENPEATFSISKVGAFHNHWLVGNIGQGFIDPFILTFDYANSRVAFTKR